MYKHYSNNQGNNFNPMKTEGIKHKFSKFMIYEIIKNKTKDIQDNYGNEVKFLEGIDGEFLHIESPAYKTKCTNTNKTLYGNINNNCSSGEDRDFRKFTPMCGFNYEYGCIGVIPCWVCMEYNKYNHMNIDLGYVADISYGAYDTHKKWVEIVDAYDVSEHKIRFCLNNDIEIYKINADDIDYESDYIELVKLDEEYLTRFDDKRELEFKKVESLICSFIDDRGHMAHKEFKDYIQSISRNYNEVTNYYNRFIDLHGMKIFTFGRTKKEIEKIKDFDLYKEYGHKKILMTKSVYEELKSKL